MSISELAERGGVRLRATGDGNGHGHAGWAAARLGCEP